MSKYRLSVTAKEDLIRIYQYGTLRFGASQADKYFNKLFDYFDKIGDHPYSYEAVDYVKEGYKRCPVGSDTIYYRIVDQMVEIMAIIGRQDIADRL
jgi:toxin ParE1/3/4